MYSVSRINPGFTSTMARPQSLRFASTGPAQSPIDPQVATQLIQRKLEIQQRHYDSSMTIDIGRLVRSGFGTEFPEGGRVTVEDAGTPDFQRIVVHFSLLDYVSLYFKPNEQGIYTYKDGTFTSGTEDLKIGPEELAGANRMLQRALENLPRIKTCEERRRQFRSETGEPPWAPY